MRETNELVSPYETGSQRNYLKLCRRPKPLMMIRQPGYSSWNRRGPRPAERSHCLRRKPAALLSDVGAGRVRSRSGGLRPRLHEGKKSSDNANQCKIRQDEEGGAKCQGGPHRVGWHSKQQIAKRPLAGEQPAAVGD